MHAMSGYLEFPEDRRESTLAALKEICIRSRQDPGCIDYWWAEDVEQPNRFRFFECWEPRRGLRGPPGQALRGGVHGRPRVGGHRIRRHHPRHRRATLGAGGLTPVPTPAPRLVLRGGPGGGGRRLRAGADATVVVDGDRIASVGRRRCPVELRPDDRVVDLGGRTVMPGMVNCHFHATYHNLGSATAPFGLEEPMAMQVVRAVRNLETPASGPGSPAP